MQLSKRIGTALAIACGAAFLLMAIGTGAQSPRPGPAESSTYAEQLPFDRGAAGLWQTLKKLHTRASLIMFTAHPDDEDGGMLTYESRGQGARSVLLTLNRGEGGANVMSPDYFDALGLVRTEELLAADRYYGTQQYWTRVCDYGFSKSLQEAIDKWTVNRVLFDAVRVIRMTHPLVVTSVFVGGPSDGHGNHQMAGMIAQLAFKAAGDPKVFPEQIREGLHPWAPLKDYARVPFARITSKGIYDYSDGKYYPARFHNYVDDRWTAGELETNVEIPEGKVSPLLGLSYAQIAREGLGFQKSQNGGTGPFPYRPMNSGYHRFASRVPASEHENSFFEGIDTSLMGIADLARGQDTTSLKSGLARINGLVEQAMKDYSAVSPEKIAPVLAQGLEATNGLIRSVESSSLSNKAKYDVNFELKVKRQQFDLALTQALGLSELATVAPDREPTGMMARFLGIPDTFRVAIPGQKFNVKVHLADEGSLPVELKGVQVKASSGQSWTATALGATSGALAGESVQDVSFSVQVPESEPLTRPYFTRPDIEQPYYNINNQKDLNLPLPPYPLSAEAEFSYDGVSFSIQEVIQTAQRATGPGLVLEPLVIGPAVSVWISPRAGIVPLGTKSFTVNATIHSNVKGPAKGVVRLELPSGWEAQPQPFSLAKDGEDQTLSFKVAPRDLEEKAYAITADAEYNGHQYRDGYQTVGYQGLRPYFLYRPAVYQTSGVNVKVAQGVNVGYIMGAGDDVPESLENLGIKVHFLTAQDLATGDLSHYDVILMGVRTYAVREDLRTYNSRILDYVKNGGVVVVQYNTPEFDHNYGPYPYSMTNNPEEVTNEASTVDILKPGNPVFNWPNKITTADFRGWVEERGSKFMKTWDPHYQALLETHDAGQSPQEGGLLYARYGKGIYIYNAYAFYRELPAGVPGAYRIIANMVSLPKNPEREK